MGTNDELNTTPTPKPIRPRARPPIELPPEADRETSEGARLRGPKQSSKPDQPMKADLENERAPKRLTPSPNRIEPTEPETPSPDRAPKLAPEANPGQLASPGIAPNSVDGGGHSAL